MVPHPAGQIGLDSINVRSKTTGSNHFSVLSPNPMVSGTIDALFRSKVSRSKFSRSVQGRCFQDRFVKIDFFKVDLFKVDVSMSVQGRPAPRPKTYGVRVSPLHVSQCVG